MSMLKVKIIKKTVGEGKKVQKERGRIEIMVEIFKDKDDFDNRDDKLTNGVTQEFLIM